MSWNCSSHVTVHCVYILFFQSEALNWIIAQSLGYLRSGTAPSNVKAPRNTNTTSETSQRKSTESKPSSSKSTLKSGFLLKKRKPPASNKGAGAGSTSRIVNEPQIRKPEGAASDREKSENPSSSPRRESAKRADSTQSRRKSKKKTKHSLTKSCEAPTCSNTERELHRVFQQCGLCEVRYCSRECSVQDWKRHKRMCTGRTVKKKESPE